MLMWLLKKIPTEFRKSLLLCQLFQVTEFILSSTQKETKKIAENSFPNGKSSTVHHDWNYSQKPELLCKDFQIRSFSFFMVYNKLGVWWGHAGLMKSVRTLTWQKADKTNALENFTEGKGRAGSVPKQQRQREGMKRSSTDEVIYPISLGNMGYFSGDSFWSWMKDSIPCFVHFVLFQVPIPGFPQVSWAQWVLPSLFSSLLTSAK